LDLVRLVALAQRRGESGALPYLASFFKSPLATSLHDFTQQFALLEHWAAQQYPHPSAAATSANATSAARS
jgi:myo-inositol-1-phosphate synthase